MSRRKQAKPRSFKPVTEIDSLECSPSLQDNPNTENQSENHDASDVCYEASPSDFGDDAQSSHNNLHLEVNSSNMLESDELATDHEASSFSASLDDSPTSSGASSCATPTSAGELPHPDATPYACGFCKKAFPRFSFLKKHEQMHNDQMPFRCEFCSRLFKHKRSRDRHIMLHTGDKKYRCICCDAAFSRSDHLKIHMKTHGSIKVSTHKLPASQCNMTGLFAYEKRPKVQWLSSDGPNLICSRMNPNEETTSSLESYPCQHCGVCFESITQLQDHISSEHPTSGRAQLLSSLLDASDKSWPDAPPINSKLACIYCASDIFTSMEQLKLHVQVVHNSALNGEFNEIGYTDVTRSINIPSVRDLPTSNSENHIVHVSHFCEVCNLKFSSIQKLQQHIHTVHPNYEIDYSKLSRDSYTCGKCLISYATWEMFAEHCLTLHDGSPSDLLLLPSNSDYPKYVSTSRKSKSALEQTSVPRPYEHGTLLCNQCDAALPNFESFRNHVKSHLVPSPSIFEADCENTASHGSYLARTCPYCTANLHGDADECEQHVASHFLAMCVEYECKCCMTAFTSPEELQSHVLEAHVQRLYRCSLCKRTFDSKLPLQVHFAVEHSNECQLYRCTACSYTSSMFHSKLEFFLHVRNAHGTFAEPTRPKSIECSFCRQQFNTNIEMQFHLNDHIKQFHCKYCPESFHIEYLLDKHVEFSHSDLQVMDDMSFATNQQSETSIILSKPQRKGSKSNIIQNDKYQDMFDSDNYSEFYEGEFQTCLNQNSEESINVRCTLCGDSCKSRSDLEAHLKQHLHGNSVGKYKCNICDEVCSSAAILAEHKLTHCKIISSNNCTHCKTTLTNKEQFYTHLVHHSSNTNISNIDNDNNNNKNIGNENINNGRKSKTKLSLPTSCIICRQTLMSDIEVKIHSEFHLNNLLPKKEYEKECCVCKGHTDNKNLCIDCYASAEKPLTEYAARCAKCHVACAPAGNSKSYICAQCSESVSDPSDSSHECHLCKAVLSSAVDLEIHLIEHTFVGYSSYTCYLCSAVFTASQGLRNHIIEHGLEARPYDCTNCNVKFYFRAQLENHNFIHEENVAKNENVLANQECDNY